MKKFFFKFISFRKMSYRFHRFLNKGGYPRYYVMTEEQKKLREVIIKTALRKDAELLYFPKSDSVMIQTDDKAHTIFIGTGELSYTNTDTYIEKSIDDVFSELLIRDISWRIERRRKQAKEYVFGKKMNIINKIINMTTI